MCGLKFGKFVGFEKTINNQKSETGPIVKCSILPHRHPHALIDWGARRQKPFASPSLCFAQLHFAHSGKSTDWHCFCMSENNLFHFAQVVSEMPAQPHSTQDQSRADVRSVFSIRQVRNQCFQPSAPWNSISCKYQSLVATVFS